MTDLAERYAGKPMLRLLDAYVLDALGALDPQTTAANEANAPKLAAALHVPATTWQGVVEQAMELPPDSVETLRAMWEQHVHDAIERGETPDVVAWTHDLVDARFDTE